MCRFSEKASSLTQCYDKPRQLILAHHARSLHLASSKVSSLVEDVWLEPGLALRGSIVEEIDVQDPLFELWIEGVLSRIGQKQLHLVGAE